MTISDVRIRMVQQSNGKLRAAASITIDECFVVHDIKIIEFDGNLFVAMPSRKTTEGEYKDIEHPINSGTREMIQREILDAYVKLLEN